MYTLGTLKTQHFYLHFCFRVKRIFGKFDYSGVNLPFDLIKDRLVGTKSFFTLFLKLAFLKRVSCM